MARLALARLLERSRVAYGVLVEAAQLGLLAPEDLRALAAARYERRSVDFDPGRQGLELRLAESAVAGPLGELAPGPRLLDLFCGAGREAEFFAARGFEVTAVDSSRAMIARAVARGVAARFVESEVEAFVPPSSFDAVYVPPWMYGTYPGRRRRIEFLERIAGWLSPGGIAAISIGTPAPRSRADRGRHAVARLVGTATSGNLSLEPGDRLRHEVFEHLFAPGEIETELREGGWSIDRRVPYPPCDLEFFLLGGRG